MKKKKLGWLDERGVRHRGLPNPGAFYAALEKVKKEFFVRPESEGYEGWPVNIIVIDRTRFSALYYEPQVCLGLREPTLEEALEGLRTASLNLSLAKGEVDRAVRNVEDVTKKLEKAK